MWLRCCSVVDLHHGWKLLLLLLLLLLHNCTKSPRIQQASACRRFDVLMFYQARLTLMLPCCHA
jgi:hypothetical protein